MPELSAIVVSHNTRDLLLRCIEALVEPREVSMDVWVIDNASSDGSADAVADAHADVGLIRNEANRGFAAACNQGIHRSTSRYVLLVNSDAFIDSALPATIVQFMDLHEDAGAAGCKLLNLDGTVQASCFRTPSLLQAVLELVGYNARRPDNRFNRSFRMLDWDYDSVREVDCVAGACMVVRRGTIQQVGALDERYYLYFEDFDWCRRIREAGWKVLYCPDARAVHVGGASAKIAGADLGSAPLDGLKRYMYRVNENRPIARTLVGAAAGGWIAAARLKRAILRRRALNGGRDG